MILSDARLHHKLDEWNRAGLLRVGAPVVDEQEDKAPLLAVDRPDQPLQPPLPGLLRGRCNSSSGYFLDLETVRGMLRALVERQAQPCRHIQFSGGEPTLHPQFLEILRMAREMGFDHIQVATNGARSRTTTSPGAARTRGCTRSTCSSTG